MLKIRCFFIGLSLSLLGCGRQDPMPLGDDREPVDEISQLEVAGVENVYRISPRIITGGEPESKTGFAELQKLGVKTIVSVTDEAPDEETAKQYGLKYVHVPMNYEGLSLEQRKDILDAFSDHKEPVYIHCNSGRNRGATAAAICLIGVEGKSNDDAIAWMKQRGVDEKNKKLYDAVQDYDPDNASD